MLLWCLDVGAWNFKVRAFSRRLLRFLFTLDLLKQPRAAEIPPSVSRRDRNAKHFGRLFYGEADEVAELDQFGFLFVSRGEFLRRVVNRQQLIVLPGGGDFNFLNVEPRLSAAVARRAFASGV